VYGLPVAGAGGMTVTGQPWCGAQRSLARMRARACARSSPPPPLPCSCSPV
jgi:hypothetical protein